MKRKGKEHYLSKTKVIHTLTVESEPAEKTGYREKKDQKFGRIRKKHKKGVLMKKRFRRKGMKTMSRKTRSSLIENRVSYDRAGGVGEDVQDKKTLRFEAVTGRSATRRVWGKG